MIERTEWVRALSALPSDELMAVSAGLSSTWVIHPKAVPQSGLGMLKLKDGACEEAFYLGEFPLATAWLQIKTPEGLIAEGAAQIMDDRIEFAQALALCDAVLSARLPGWEQLAELLDKGMAIREAIGQERKQMLAATQVDFSLLDELSSDSMGADDARA